MCNVPTHSDRRALRDNFSLFGHTDGDDSINGSVNFCVAELCRYLSRCCARLFELCEGSVHGTLASGHLLAVFLSNCLRCSLSLHGFFQRLHSALRNSYRRLGVIAILRGHFSFVEQLLHALQVILVALQLCARGTQLRLG